MGILKKKRHKKGGIKKPAHFYKMGTRKIKKIGQRLVGAKKIRFKIKKKMGRKWAQGENLPLSKNGRQK